MIPAVKKRKAKSKAGNGKSGKAAAAKKAALAVEITGVVLVGLAIPRNVRAEELAPDAFSALFEKLRGPLMEAILKESST